jgi:succinate dehydrogenase / fumarate reductase, cytochrome b subunit
MGTIAVGVRDNVAARFWDTTNGKKTVMAVSGFILFGFVIGHMLGNLQVFEGQDAFNNYAKFLRSVPLGLWLARITLLASVVLHITASVQLALRKKRARPVSYTKKESIASTYASRTMYWSGPIILAFVIYHLLQFTFGVTGVPNFHEGDVYGNVISGFQQPLIALWYIISMMLLCLHLRHGVWSMFQTLGVNHPRYTPILRVAATIFALVVAIGFVSIPVSVLAGWVT